MSLKTPMFQEIPFNSFRGESLSKTLPTDSRTGQKHYTLATSLRGVYAFQHTSNLTNLSLTLFLAHLAVARVIFCHRFAFVVRPSETIHSKIFSSETTGPIKTKLGHNGP